MAGSRLYHAVVAVGIIVCVVQCQVAAQEAGGSREVRAIIWQPSPAGFILTRHMWDDLDASTDPIVQASSKRYIQTTVSSEDGKLTVSGAASVFANPFWAAERIGRARGALPKPTEFRLGVSLYEAQVARLRDWRRTIENTLSVAVVTVLGPQAGVAAWLALEVHAHSVWAGDNIIRFRLPLTRLPGRVQPHDSPMTVDVAQVVATHCADRGCGGKNTTTMAQLAAHLRCAQRMLQRLDDARAVAPEAAPGLPSWAPVTFSVVDGRQVCGATIAVPLSHEGVGFAAGVDAQVDGFSAQHGVSDTVRQRLRATARAQATFSSPLVGPDVEVATSAFPTGSPTEAVPVLVEHLKKSWAHAEAGVSRLATEVLQMPGMSAQQNRHLMNNLCSLRGTRYLEIGSYQGSTLVSCVYGNAAAVDHAVAIDTFQISNPAALEHHLDTMVGNSVPLTVIQSDCFQVNASALAPTEAEKFNVYLYDGEHREEDQYLAFTHYEPALADVFVAIVDDWNWLEVEAGTRRAFAELGFRVLWERDVKTEHNGNPEWWNGFYVALVAKPSAQLQSTEL